MYFKSSRFRRTLRKINACVYIYEFLSEEALIDNRRLDFFSSHLSRRYEIYTRRRRMCHLCNELLLSANTLYTYG